MLLKGGYLGLTVKKQRCEKALQELSSAHSADIRFILATKVELFAAEGGQRKRCGSFCGSLRGSVQIFLRCDKFR